MVKQLNFSLHQDESINQSRDDEEEEMTSQLHNLSITLQKQLDEKSEEVSSLKSEIEKLRVRISMTQIEPFAL